MTNFSALDLLFGFLAYCLPGFALAMLVFPKSRAFWWVIGAVFAMALNGLAVLAMGILAIPVTRSSLLWVEGFLLVVILVAALRVRQLPAWSLPKSKGEMVQGGILVLSLFILALGLAQTVQISREHYTEFYFQDALADTPAWQVKAISTDAVTVTLVIVNHEKEDVLYTVQGVNAGASFYASESLLVGQGETLQVPVRIPASTDPSAPYQFHLYRVDGSTQPYRSLSIWLDFLLTP